MTALRILSNICWGLMLLYVLRGAVAAWIKHARFGDPMRLACAPTAVVVISFNMRWLLWRDDESLLKALLVLSSVLALYILRLAHTYGRGALLHRNEEGRDAS
ncbi:hypothetical protein [Sphingomonas sp. BK069]|uniref:hypothetical protein n=1 Tax=Sphingomonas sp. BK069 TaxID=2586979 RepID=UPI001615D379|nr:hypothetical protein [Sphingomonas sp. BK069]MBB3348803.1 hypothetical protein [Sphingomonas sp. BK069]